MAQAVPLVGRDDVVAELRQGLGQAAHRRGQLFLVSGEPGIGKSALADLVGREAEGLGANVAFGRAWELAEAPPYFPLWSCLRGLGIEPPQGDVAEADAFALWERVLEALARAATIRPVVWILEDLHAADLQTLDLLTYLARPLRSLSVLLLLTLRDRDPRIGERLAGRLARLGRDGRELRLDPLDRAQVQALAESVAGRALDAASVRALDELTGGNPLFVIECARSQRAGGQVPLPASIRALTAERVALLPERARAALAGGAIVGRDFSAALVARMLDGLPAQVIDWLAPALRAGLVVESRPGHFRFSHILVRDAVEDALGAGSRADLHGRAAAALATEGDAVDILVERSRHALAAGTGEGDAVGLALRAARVLTALGAHDRALALYHRIEDAHAAGLVQGRAEPEEALRRAAVARAAGRHAEARQRCEAVLQEARAAGDGASVARAALALGAELRPATVDAGLVSALRDALSLGPGDPALCCRVEARLAAALQPAEDPQGPMAMARTAIARARAQDDPALLLEVLQSAGSALVDLAPLEERLALGEELLLRAAAAGDVPRQLVAHARLALDHVVAGDFDAFDSQVVRLRVLSTELGHPRWRWRPLFIESMRAIAHGDGELSDRCLVEIQQHAGLTDDPALAMALQAHTLTRCMLFHRDDELRGMLDWVQEGLASLPFGDLLAAHLRMTALARQEDSAGAARELARIRARGSLCYEWLELVGEGCALVGSPEEQRALHAVLLPLQDRHLVAGHVPMTYEGPIQRMLGLLESSLGDHASAVTRLEQALGGARERGHLSWVAQIGYDLGRVLAAAGRTEEARRELAAAAEQADALVMPGLVARATARLAGMTAAVAGAPAMAAASPMQAPADQRPFSQPPDAPASPGGAAAGPATHVPAAATELAVRIEREGDVWRVETGARAIRVRHSRGIELLARLVERAGEELHVLALVSDAGASLLEGDAGELLDPQARREYQARLADLEAELAEAEANHDQGRTSLLARERDLLESELARATGLGGRARAGASASERARVNAQRRLKDAITRIAEADAELGARLGAAVHTGTYCCFRP